MGSAVKSVTKAVSNVGKAVEKGVRDVGKGAENIVREAKPYTDAIAGTVVREGASIFTGGMSEQMGLGDKISSQFGGNEDIRKLGAVYNQIQGVGRQKAINMGLASLAGGQNPMEAFGGGQMPAAPANYVEQSSGGNGNMSFLSDLGDFALDYGRDRLMSSSKDGRRMPAAPSQPAAPAAPPAVITVPAPQQDSGIDSKTMMMVGGGLAALIGLAVILKR